jgi:hypothetical protein
MNVRRRGTQQAKLALPEAVFCRRPQTKHETHFIVALTVRVTVYLHREAVVQQEAAVALFAIAVEHLWLTSQHGSHRKRRGS